MEEDNKQSCSDFGVLYTGAGGTEPPTTLETAGDRWDLSWPGEKLTEDRLGDDTIARYRRFRMVVESQDKTGLDDVTFGLLLGAESLRDEMRSYESGSDLFRLAQTGYFVRKLQQLNRLLDAVDFIKLNETSDQRSWMEPITQERHERIEVFDRMLGSCGCKWRANDDDTSESFGDTDCCWTLADETEIEEALTMLISSIKVYGNELTDQETLMVNAAILRIQTHNSAYILTIPKWFVSSFDFGGSYGLSRWGNELRFLDYDDRSRVIREANIWSDLNHPHIAKFLGACHVGSRPFIAHESVRPLDEYLDDVTDRKKLWSRLYEVALGLQYLHERRLVCGEFAVYCAQFEDKAMLLGVGLTAIKLSDSSGGRRESGETVPSMEADIRSLGQCIFNALTRFTLLTRREPRYPPTPHPSLTLSTNNEPRELPAHKPDEFTANEWNLLEKLLRPDSHSYPNLLYVILRLGELAGNVQRNWLDDAGISLSLPPEDTIPDVREIQLWLLFMSVRDIMEDCAKKLDLITSMSRIHSRLDNVLSQLQQGAPDNVNRDAVAHTCSILIRLYNYLISHTRSSAGCQVVMSQRAPVSILSFHMDIDHLIDLHSLSGEDAVHLWQDEWQRLRSDTPRLTSVTADAFVNQLSRDNQLEFTEGKAYCEFELARYRHSLDTENRETISPSFRQLMVSNWFVPPYEIEYHPNERFGDGSFGAVHHGKWFDTKVVVKSVLKDPASDPSILKEFRHEADVWFGLNHINVVKMYGACDVGQPFFLCEYASGGALDSFLARLNNREPYLIWYCLLNAALGLQYLHDKGIVHGDLKANNILVGADGVAKLADFGLSIQTRSGASIGLGGALGAFRWKAPECIPLDDKPGESASLASDVFSFAMCMIEALTGTPPWSSLPDDLAVITSVKKGVLPTQPHEIADSEWQLIQQMCRLNPAERLTIDAVVVYISSVLERLDRIQLDSISRDGEIAFKPYKNYITSRNGALLNLLSLATSDNKVLAKQASDHLVTVQINRNSRSSEGEIAGVTKLLRHGSRDNRIWAAQAIIHLARDRDANRVAVVATGAIPALVEMISDGNDLEQDMGTSALWNLSYNEDNQAPIRTCGAIPVLVALLSIGSDRVKESAAAVLRNMANNAENQVAIAREGGIIPLIALVCNGTDLQKEQAAGAIRGLALNDDNSVRIADAGGIPPLVALVNDGNDSQKKNAASALAALSYHNKVKVAAAGGIPALVSLARSYMRAQVGDSCVALANLSIHPDNRAEMVSAGVIPVMTKLADTGNDVDKESAAATFRNLSRTPKIAEMIGDLDVIPVLISLVQDGNDTLKEDAAGALLNLALNDACREKIAKASGIPALIKLLCDDQDAQKEVAVVALNNLAANDSCRENIANANGIPALIKLLRDGNDELKVKAVMALTSLSLNITSQAAIAEAGGIQVLVKLVSDGSKALKEKAIGALMNMSLNASNQISMAEGIPACIKLISDGDGETKLDALKVLLNLSQDDVNKIAIAKAGGIPSLVELLSKGSIKEKDVAGSILAILTANSMNDIAIADAGGIPTLVELLLRGNITQKEQAAISILNLSMNTENKKAVTAAGGIPALVKMIWSGTCAQRDHAAMALVNLSSTPETQQAIVDADGISALINLCKCGNDVQKERAALLLVNMASCADYQGEIISSEGVPAFVAMCANGNDVQKARAALVLNNLATNEATHPSIQAAGGISELVKLVQIGNAEIVDRAANALWCLSSTHSSSLAITAAGGIQPLVVLLGHGSEFQKEMAVAALANISTISKYQNMIADMGCIPDLIQLVQSGNDKQQLRAARVLCNLCVNADGMAARGVAVAIPALVSLISSGGVEQQEAALMAIVNLSLNLDNHAAMAEAGAVLALVTAMRHNNGQQKMRAVSALCNLTINKEMHTNIAQAGGIPALISMICEGNDEQKEIGVVTLSNLSVSAENRVCIVAAGGIMALASLFFDGNAVQLDWTLGVLVNLSMDAGYLIALAEIGLIPKMLALVRNGTDVQKVRAAYVLSNLTSIPANRIKVAESDGINALLVLVREGNDLQKEYAIDAVSRLALDSLHKEAIAKAGGIPDLITVVSFGTEDQKSGASYTLWNLAYNSNDNCSIIVASCGIPVLLKLVIDGNETQRTNAAGILGFLRLNEDTNNVVAEYGGVASLLKNLADDNSDDDIEEILVALLGLCTRASPIVRSRFWGSPHAETLVKMAETERHQNLASSILAEVNYPNLDNKGTLNDS